eukprot:483129_1
MTICKICSLEDEHDCSHCHNAFTIQHETLGVDSGQYTIEIKSNNIDASISPNKHMIQYYTNQIEHTNTTKFNNDYLYFLFLLIIPLFLIAIVVWYCRKGYMNAFIVDNTLVLIIGISYFDDEKLLLPGVAQNVMKLKRLWRDLYNYDVFVCNDDGLYCTKQSVINFIDKYKEKLIEKVYNGVIVHIISHGDIDNSFTTSDGYRINVGFIQHELVSIAEQTNNLELIKVIFYHCCRGYEDYHSVTKTVASNTEQTYENQDYTTRTRGSSFRLGNIVDNNDENTLKMSHDSNLMIVSGNIIGRTMSDSGYFTECIFDAFKNNLERVVKDDFNALLVEIGRNLELKSNHAEVCNYLGTLRYKQIRFEKCVEIKQTKDIGNDRTTNMEIEMVRNDNYANNIFNEQMQYSIVNDTDNEGNERKHMDAIEFETETRMYRNKSYNNLPDTDDDMNEENIS